MELKEKVTQIICEKLGVSIDKVTVEKCFIEDLGADSLDQVELIMALEDEFNIEISDEDAFTIKTVNDCIDYVTKRMGGC